jgi:hypothetical protein
MKEECDFSRGKLGPAISTRGKTRITIYLDDEILATFKSESARTGAVYQTLINEALAQQVGKAEKSRGWTRQWSWWRLHCCAHAGFWHCIRCSRS